MENDTDEDSFEDVISTLDCDVHPYSAECELGSRCALGGGVTKRDILCDYINSKV